MSRFDAGIYALDLYSWTFYPKDVDVRSFECQLHKKMRGRGLNCYWQQEGVMTR